MLRFWNNQVFLQTEAVLRAIEYALEEVAPKSQVPYPSPSVRGKGLKAMRWLQTEACGVQPAEGKKKNNHGLGCGLLGVLFFASG